MALLNSIHHSTIALLHSSTWLYVSLLCPHFTVLESTFLPLLCFTVLDSTLLYYGSTSLHLTLHYFTLLYCASTSLHLTLHYSTMALLHATRLIIISTWLHITLLWLYVTPLVSTLLYPGSTSFHWLYISLLWPYFTVLESHCSTSLYWTLHCEKFWVTLTIFRSPQLHSFCVCDM